MVESIELPYLHDSLGLSEIIRARAQTKSKEGNRRLMFVHTVYKQNTSVLQTKNH